MDFSDVETEESVQTLDLSAAHLQSGAASIPLKFVKLQNVGSIAIFVDGNQAGGDETVIEQLTFYGCPVMSLEVSGIKEAAKAMHDH